MTDRPIRGPVAVLGLIALALAVVIGTLLLALHVPRP